jgi:hypothetical protein
MPEFHELFPPEFIGTALRVSMPLFSRPHRGEQVACNGRRLTAVPLGEIAATQSRTGLTQIKA